MRPSLVLLPLLLSGPTAAQDFVNFESPQTRPLAISADGTKLFALNTPDARLAVFSLADPDAPVLEQEIRVGLEPVAVTARTADEVWVVCRLSDAVAVVSLQRGAVVATIRTPDEPADVAFAGAPERAFVSGSGTDEVRVFDAATRAPVGTVPIFGQEPRALGVDRGRGQVFVAVHRSGNGTTIVPEADAPPPPAPRNAALPSAPRQGLIVRADDPAWRGLGVSLPDHDVFAIDAATLAVTRRWSAVGTTLFAVAVHPTRDELWVAHSDAQNLVRFEPELRGRAVQHQVTRLSLAAAAKPHVVPVAAAQPAALCFAPDGKTLWVAGFGSDVVLALDADGRPGAQVALRPPGEKHSRAMRGPRGLAHHPRARRLYVLNRVAHTLAVVDTERARVVTQVSLGFDPTPRPLAAARGFLYDATRSATGTQSCAGCHVDGEFDGLAWDLGDPDGAMDRVANGPLIPILMHPMKGPMTTQTLRGLTRHGAPFHRRGDRPRLHDFNSSFRTLLGAEELGPQDLEAFVGFLESLAFPPNPQQNLDRTFAADAERGRDLFMKLEFQGALRCTQCHIAEQGGTNGLLVHGQFHELQSQAFDPPQLRDVYKRLGRVVQDGRRKSGFGLMHDGSVDSVADFLARPFFRELSRHDEGRRLLERFVLSFDTGTAPSVGHSCTVAARSAAAPEVVRTLDLLEAQAKQNCDLVVHGSWHGRPHGFAFDASTGRYQSDGGGLPPALSREDLLAAVRTDGACLTWLGVPPGSGRRCGVDRDRDGVLDGDEPAAKR